MAFQWEQRGNPEGEKIFLFQDLTDSRKSMQEIGRVLEPLFSVHYLYLPSSIHWMDFSALSHLQKEAQKLYTLIEPRKAKITGISGGMSFSFWRTVLGERERYFSKFYLFHPDQDIGDPIGNFLEVWKVYFRRKSGSFFLDWLKAQPLAYHMFLAKNKLKNKPEYCLHFIRTDKPESAYKVETKLLQTKFNKVEWSRFGIEDPETLKFSKAIKKFLLIQIAADYGIKSSSYWTHLLGI